MQHRTIVQSCNTCNAEQTMRYSVIGTDPYETTPPEEHDCLSVDCSGIMIVTVNEVKEGPVP